LLVVDCASSAVSLIIRKTTGRGYRMVPPFREHGKKTAVQDFLPQSSSKR